jgi:Bacterial archaeo-eukaryotic release factor family 2
MESSEALPRDAVEATDLREIVRSAGPFLSLFLNTEQNVEKAAKRTSTRWKTIRSDLDDRGVSPQLLGEIDEIVPDAHQRGACLAAIGGTEQLLHVEHGPPVGPNDEATVGPLPLVRPIIRWRQSQPPYVVVLIDRTGADLFGVRRGSRDLHAEVEGEHDVIRKVKPGGWSQHRFQQRAEDSWEQNAEQVAGSVERIVLQTQPVFVAVAGDVRAVGLLRASLPKEIDDLVHAIEGERPWDGKGDPIPDEVDELVDRHVREAGARLLERFEQERGQRDKAVEGAAATAAALTRAQVATLLVGDSVGDQQLWFGPDPTLVAASDTDLKELGVDSPERGPAHDVLVRAALATDASVRIVDEGAPLEEGVGGLLRWSTR